MCVRPVPVEERPVGRTPFAELQRGDIAIAAKLDRLFRSALDALKVVESLKGRGVKLHLLDLGRDIAGHGISKLFLTGAGHRSAATSSSPNVALPTPAAVDEP
jgi:DNA invertase Pin-like site-specific DNA recombinase